MGTKISSNTVYSEPIHREGTILLLVCSQYYAILKNKVQPSTFAILVAFLFAVTIFSGCLTAEKKEVHLKLKIAPSNPRIEAMTKNGYVTSRQA